MKYRFTKTTILLSAAFLSFTATVRAEHTTPIKYGNFDSWVTRNIPESKILGGKTKQVYAIGPTSTINGAKAYTPAGGSPWATSNVMAKVMGVTKASNAVTPAQHGAGKCARMVTTMDHIKAAGMVNMDVVVAGTIFLGKMLEPVTSTKNPYAKMEMGIPFTQRPVALTFDYNLSVPKDQQRTYSSGFGKKKTVPGQDRAEVMILLQYRWEDANGNIFAKRVGTGHELLGRSTSGWVNTHRVPINYGNASHLKPLIPKQKSYYARNSKGKMVPVQEVDWAAPGTAPTHMILMFSSGSGEPYTGTIGTEFLVDNVGLVYS